MHRWSAIALWILAAVSGSAVAKEPRAQTSGLTAGRLATPRPFNWRLPKGRAAAETQDALRGKVARRQVVFVDVDGDGRFDEPGVDGWAIEPSLYLVPFDNPIVIERDLVEIQIHADTKKAVWRARRIDAPRDHLHALSDVNELRMRNGLPPAAYSAEISKACALHCAYMDRHGITHYQQKGKPGYTPAGAAAGVKANVATSTDLDRVGLDSYRTFFHRRTLMEPDTYEIGLAVGKGHVMLDGLSRRRKDVAWQYPIIVPAPGTESVPLDFDHSEHPPPVPKSPPAGFPITLRWPPYVKISDVKASLRTVKRKKTIPTHVSWMEKPAHASIQHNQFSICIIPKRVLKGGTGYRVEVEAAIDGKPYRTSFVFVTEGVRRR